MRTFVPKAILFTLPILVIAVLLNPILDRYFINPFNWRPFGKMHWILTIQNKSYDYAFIGSSRVKYMADTTTIDAAVQRNGINLGTDGSGFADNYLLYKFFLQQGNTARVLVINVDPYVLDSKRSFGYPFHDFLFLPRLNDSDVKEAIIDVSGMKKWLLWKYLPGAKYVEFNQQFIQTVLNNLRHGDPQSTIDVFNKNHGSELIFNTLAEPFPPRERQSFNLNQTDAKYLLKLVDLAESDGARVFLYTAPEYNGIEQYQDNRHLINEQIKDFTESNGLTFLEINDKNIENNPVFFRDWLHLNATGTKIFSQRLAEALRFDLEANK